MVLSQCDIAYPDTKQVRRKHKISTPDYDQEAAVTTTPGIPDISIRHTPDLRGGFAELQRKGLKFTSYQTTEKE